MTTPAQPSTDEAQRSGMRPRTATVTLAATRELIAEIGFDALRTELVAQRAGISKATLYRWWPNKVALVMDAIEDIVSTRVPTFASDDAREDLRCSLRALFAFANTEGPRRVMTNLTASALHEPELASALRTFRRRQSAALEAIVHRGVEAGELRDDIDAKVAVQQLVGPMWYRMLVTGEALPPRLADTLVDQLWSGISA